MAGEFAGSDAGGAAGGAGAAAGGAGGLGALLSPEAISQMLGPYIREVQVRVYWGEDSESSEEDGREVVLITHVINPSGQLSQLGNEVTQ